MTAAFGCFLMLRALDPAIREADGAISQSERIVEARFHPYRKADPRYVVAGWVIFNVDHGPLVLSAMAKSQTAASDAAFAAAPAVPESRALLLKLRYLVETATDASAEGLLALRSSFWSFVDVSDVTLQQQPPT